MDNKEYENRYNGTAKKLRIIGILLLIIGLGCVVTGMTDFFMSTIGHGSMPTLFFLCFVGFPFCAGGGICLTLGSQKKMNAYIASQNAEAAKDFRNYMNVETADTTAEMAGKVASSVVQAAGVEGVTMNTCSKCGHQNPAGAKFCAKCGAIIVKKCPYCGAENDDSAKFCNNCGKNLM